MASAPLVADRNYREQMDEFPCTFNLVLQQDINLRKTKLVMNKLIEELQFERDEFDEEQKIRKMNMLTWTHFNMDEVNKATLVNNEVIELTQGQNMTALGNRVFLDLHDGDIFEAQEYLKKLRCMTSAPNFNIVLATAKAEQAYCHNRLGGGYHCRMAIKLFKEALQHHPDKALWEYGLGLAYRKMANVNLNLSSPEKESINQYTKMAAEYLFKVGDNRHAGKKLRSKAFAQLVSLRQSYPPRAYPQYNYIFHSLDIHQLCEKALADGSTFPTVLNACGKSFKNIDVDKAISYLERSVKIKDSNTTALHHLGLCYIKKADRKYRDTPTRRQHFSYAQEEFRVQQRKPIAHVAREGNVSSRTYAAPVTHRPHTAPSSSAPQQKTGFSRAQCYEQSSYTGGHMYEPSYAKRTYQSHGHRHGRQGGRPAEFSGSSFDESMVPLTCLRKYTKCPEKETPLNAEDDLVKKAIHALQKSLTTSNDFNLPALFSLGRILKRSGHLSEAVKMFNKLVNSPAAVSFNNVTVISALEEAGLCCLQLSETAPEECKHAYEEEGKRKLTMAVSYAVDLAKSKPELKGCENDVWLAFRKLNAKLEGEKLSPAVAKEKIKLLMMVEKYEKVLPVIEELLSLDENEINNPDTIGQRLTAYLELKKYEEALTFLNMLEMNTAVTTSDSWIKGTVFDLRMKVVLSALYERLGTGIHPQPLFQQLFKMMFGHCSAIDDDEMHSEGIPDSDNDLCQKRDVLFLFDEEEVTDPHKGKATRYGRRLKHVLSSLCGLDAEENLRGNFAFTPIQTEMDSQLEEVMKYQVAVIVLDDEIRSPEFEAMLHRIPYLSGPTCPQFRVLDIEGKNSPDVLSALKPYRWMKMEGIGQLNLTNPGSRGGAGVDVEDRPVQDVFRGDIDAVVKLFCFIIGDEWSHA